MYKFIPTDLNYELLQVHILIYHNFRLKEYVHELISILNLIQYYYFLFFR